MKKLLLMIIGVFIFADPVFCGNPIILVSSNPNAVGRDYANSINAELDGHALTVVFTENLGQVAIEVSISGGGEVETSSLYTPSGVIIYIPYSGSYIVTFTLSNGDEYYGEFEIID